MKGFLFFNTSKHSQQVCLYDVRVRKWWANCCFWVHRPFKENTMCMLTWFWGHQNNKQEGSCSPAERWLPWQQACVVVVVLWILFWLYLFVLFLFKALLEARGSFVYDSVAVCLIWALRRFISFIITWHRVWNHRSPRVCYTHLWACED